MARYDKLKHFLSNAKGADVDMTFAQIEGVLGRALPPSAFVHRAWWSNNPDNNVMTKAWLAAGYQTVDVDMGARTVTFECVDLPSAPTAQASSHYEVAEGPQPAFIYDSSFLATRNLSPRAQEWFNMLNDNEDVRDRLVIDVIEGLASKAKRNSIIDKYAKLNIGSGSDSVDLIRDARDER